MHMRALVNDIMISFLSLLSRVSVQHTVDYNAYVYGLAKTEVQ